MKKRKGRIYWRDQGGVLRAYADFRDLGGGREALIPQGETRATTDPVIAEALVADRLRELYEQGRDRSLLGVRRRATLGEYAAEHLVKKARSRKVTDRWLGELEHKLELALEFFGSDRDLSSIGVEHVQEYAHWLAERSNGRGGTLSTSAQRHYVTALSNLFRRAQGEAVIRGANPVSALMEKPQPRRAEARWLEVWEAALLLESARTYPYTETGPTTVGERLKSAVEALAPGNAGLQIFVHRMAAASRTTTVERAEAYVAGRRVPPKGYVLAAAHALNLPAEALWRAGGTTGV
jgi:hypothetical protein